VRTPLPPVPVLGLLRHAATLRRRFGDGDG
jgi:hypothetical protein